MSLRDRLTANYHIPLFAGIESAERSGVLAPPEIYAPGVQNPGTEHVGGIGSGDGGFDTPPDSSITTPTITNPTETSSLLNEYHIDGTFSEGGGCTDGIIAVVGSSAAEAGAAWAARLSELGATCFYPTTWTFAEVVTDDGVTGFRVRASWTNTYPNSGNWFADGTITAGTTPGYFCPDTTATSSAFSATGGRTHVASRWVIESSAGVVIYDSGPSTSHKTSLPMAPAKLKPGGTYRIRVRYKASDGNWSNWSAVSVFTIAACGAPCTRGTGPMSTVTGCTTPLPPAPPAPPPPAAPVPPPPPAPSPPAAPPGTPAIVVDVANSIMFDAVPGNLSVKLSTGTIIAGMTAGLYLVFQNTGTRAGTINVRVTADNTNVLIGPAGVVPIAVGPRTTAGQLWNMTALLSASYTLTVDTGSGTPLTIPISFVDSGGGGGA